MTILTAAQDAARLLSLPVPTSLVGNPEPTAGLLLALANRGGRALSKRYAWEALQKRHTFTSVATEAQASTAIPADYARMIPETMWNHTRRRQVAGPIDPVEWAHIAATDASVTTPSFRIRGGVISLLPLKAGESISYDYVSKNWAQASGTWADNFVADNYTSAFPEELHVLDMVWRYKKAKGLEYAGEELDFERAVADFITTDGGARTIDLTHVSSSQPARPMKLGFRDYAVGAP